MSLLRLRFFCSVPYFDVKEFLFIFSPTDRLAVFFVMLVLIWICLLITIFYLKFFLRENLRNSSERLDITSCNTKIRESKILHIT